MQPLFFLAQSRSERFLNCAFSPLTAKRTRCKPSFTCHFCNCSIKSQHLQLAPMSTHLGSCHAHGCIQSSLHQYFRPRTRWVVCRRERHWACRAAERQPLTAEEALLNTFWKVRPQPRPKIRQTLLAFWAQQLGTASCNSQISCMPAVQARGVWDQGQRATLISCLERSASSGAKDQMLCLEGMMIHPCGHAPPLQT